LEKDKFSGRNADYIDAKYLYYSIIDDGNTESLIQSIQSAMSQSALVLKDEMIEASPLSFETLLELIESEKLSNVLLYEVFTHNPGMVRIDELLYALVNKTDPMPQHANRFD
jgi:tRNA splicing endonuclease